MMNPPTIPTVTVSVSSRNPSGASSWSPDWRETPIPDASVSLRAEEERGPTGLGGFLGQGGQAAGGRRRGGLPLVPHPVTVTVGRRPFARQIGRTVLAVRRRLPDRAPHSGQRGPAASLWMPPLHAGELQCSGSTVIWPRVPGGSAAVSRNAHAAGPASQPTELLCHLPLTRTAPRIPSRFSRIAS